MAKRPDGRWRARYRDAEGKEHAKHFRTRTQGREWLDEVTGHLRQGTWVDPDRGRATVAEVAREWLAVKRASTAASTAARDETLSKRVLSRWGATRVDRVRHEDVRRWAGELAAGGLAPATVREVTRVLREMLDQAVRAGRLARNPATGLRLPRKRSARKRYLKPAEVEALATAAGEYGVVVHTLAYCGLRWGEMAALRVGRVDLERRRLLVEEAVAEVAGRLVWGDPKDAERRSVPVPEFLVDPLREATDGKGRDDLVFPAQGGGVLRINTARRRWWARACRQSGLQVTPHELRHTAASLAVSAGANVLAVARMLGHARPSMTLDVYADLFDSDLDAVATALHGLRESACGLSVDQTTVEMASAERELRSD